MVGCKGKKYFKVVRVRNGMEMHDIVGCRGLKRDRSEETGHDVNAAHMLSCLLPESLPT